METKGQISRAWLPKGEYIISSRAYWFSIAERSDRFGWVNASYVYGLQIIDAHMKRALGAITDWDTFKKMTEAATTAEANKILHKAQKQAEPAKGVKIDAQSHDALPHSHEDTVAHRAVHGNEEMKEPKAPENAAV